MWILLLTYYLLVPFESRNVCPFFNLTINRKRGVNLTRVDVFCEYWDRKLINRSADISKEVSEITPVKASRREGTCNMFYRYKCTVIQFHCNHGYTSHTKPKGTVDPCYQEHWVVVYLDIKKQTFYSSYFLLKVIITCPSFEPCVSKNGIWIADRNKNKGGTLHFKKLPVSFHVMESRFRFNIGYFRNVLMQTEEIRETNWPPVSEIKMYRLGAHLGFAGGDSALKLKITGSLQRSATSWSEAEKVCLKQGATLFTIHNSEEMEYLKKLKLTVSAKFNQFIGLKVSIIGLLKHSFEMDVL